MAPRIPDSIAHALDNALPLTMRGTSKYDEILGYEFTLYGRRDFADVIKVTGQLT